MKNVLDVLNNYLDNELKQKKERTFKVGNIHKIKKVLFIDSNGNLFYKIKVYNCILRINKDYEINDIVKVKNYCFKIIKDNAKDITIIDYKNGR